MRVIVFHALRGCDTGCCGHIVELENESGIKKRFVFDHPDDGESNLSFAKRAVTEVFGAEHCADLDWANCEILPYDDSRHE